MHFRCFLQVRLVATAADFVGLGGRFRRVLASPPGGGSSLVPLQLLVLAQVRWHFLLLVSVHFLDRYGLLRPRYHLFGRMLFRLLRGNILTQSSRSFQLKPFQLTLRLFSLPATLVSQLTSVCLFLLVLQLLLLLLLQLLFLSELLLLRYPLLLDVPLGFLSFLQFLHLFLLKHLLFLLKQHDLLLWIVFVTQHVSRLGQL